jgi:hypothetical protein
MPDDSQGVADGSVKLTERIVGRIFVCLHAINVNRIRFVGDVKIPVCRILDARNFTVIL